MVTKINIVLVKIAVQEITLVICDQVSGPGSVMIRKNFDGKIERFVDGGK
jgi:hypothetical protein